MKFSELKRQEKLNSGHLACPGCAASLSMRHALKALGSDTIAVIPACCWSIISGTYPTTALSAPILHTPFETAASSASGVRAALDMLGKSDTTVMAWAGDGGTFDIGLQALSGSLERGDNIIYVCYDNEAYMNTGIQRSSATPAGAWTTTTPHGKPIENWKKDLFSIVVAHSPAYAATATIAYPDDFYNKFKKAASIKGSRFIHLLSACPPGWKMAESDSIKSLRLAVETGIFPLLEWDGKTHLTYIPDELIPVKEYFKIQGRYKRLEEKRVNEIQKLVRTHFEKLIAQR